MKEVQRSGSVEKNETVRAAWIGAAAVVLAAVIGLMAVAMNKGSTPEEIAAAIRQVDISNNLKREKDGTDFRIEQLEKMLSRFVNSANTTITVLKPNIQTGEGNERSIEQQEGFAQHEMSELQDEIKKLKDQRSKIAIELQKMTKEVLPKYKVSVPASTTVELTQANIELCSKHRLRNVSVGGLTSGTVLQGYRVMFVITHTDGSIHGSPSELVLASAGSFSTLLKHEDINLEECIGKRRLFLEAKVFGLNDELVATTLPLLLEDRSRVIRSNLPAR